MKTLLENYGLQHSSYPAATPKS